MEFPPIIAGKTLYFVRNNGGTYALDSRTGRVKWKKRIGLESASSPAYADGRIFMTSLAGGATPGKVVALRARDGKVLWQMPLSSRSESSPIVHKGVVYLGSESGTLYALWARTGRVKWTFKASGALKASPALSGNTLYIGDYTGRMYAVWARTGSQRWSSGTSGQHVRARVRQLLLHSGRRVRPRLRRQHRQPRLFLQRRERGARLVEVDRRLRLLVAGGCERRRRRAVGLHRVLRRQPLRARCPHRIGALDSPRRRADLRRPDRGRADRLLRRPRLDVDLWRGRQDRHASVPPRPRRLQPGRLRRPADLPDRVLEHHGARAGGRQEEARPKPAAR